MAGTRSRVWRELPGGRLASGSWDRTIRLWDVATGAEVARLKWDFGPGALCVLPDGRLASGSWDRTIRLWDVARGAEAARLEGHSGKVNALCVLPDGRLLSGSDDRTIRLWDAIVQREISCLEVDAPCPQLAKADKRPLNR
jgi:WD40 repeat protein